MYIHTFHIVTILTGFMKTIIIILLLILSYEYHYILICHVCYVTHLLS